MTAVERLYFNDSYLKTFKSKIEAVEREGNNNVRLCLAATAFYPTSGGQPCDFGHIDLCGAGSLTLKVTDVTETEDHQLIWHTVETEFCQTDVSWIDLLKVGTEVTGRIDWERRFRNMQQHSGQHLISAIISQMLKLETASVHLGVTSSIDLEGSLGATEEEMRNNFAIIENEFNDRVFECRKVSVSYLDSKPNGGNVPLRSREDSSQSISQPYRVITIEGGVDSCGCCGTHVSSTGEIGPILLLGTQKARKNQTRLTYVVGVDALKYIRKQRNVVQMLDKTLDTRIENMVHVVQGLVQTRKSLKKDLEQSQRECAELYCDAQFSDASKTATIGTGEVTFKLATLEGAPLRPFEELIAQKVKSYERAVFIGISRAPVTDCSGSSVPHKIYLGAQCGLDCGACVKSLAGILTPACRPAKDYAMAIVNRGCTVPTVEELTAALLTTKQ